MRAMVLPAPGEKLRPMDVARREPGPGQILVRVHACGVCRTDLHVIDGDLPDPKTPLIPGHQIVGRVIGAGAGAGRFRLGDRVGIPWLGGSCGRCRFCRSGRENLCHEAVYTGYQIDGGFSEECVANEDFCFSIPDGFPDLHAAPLLCAGVIGYRSYRLALESTFEVNRLGLYGFGAAAHILVQVARHEGRKVFAFTKEGDRDAQTLATELGADWVGSSSTEPPEPLDAAIIFAPVGSLVPAALRAVDRGGAVICAGIHMSDVPGFPYRILWQERMVRSVANLTRDDGEAFLAVAAQIPIRTRVQGYPLLHAEKALSDLRRGRIQGAAVVVVHEVSQEAGGA